MGDGDQGRLLSTVEVGWRLGVSTRDVYDLIEAGYLPAYRTSSGVRIPETAVDDRLT